MYSGISDGIHLASSPDPAVSMISKRRAVAILLLEGLASSGIQMITIRQTVPFVGSSVLSTSVIISSFLAALAIGYYWGGKQDADRYVGSLSFNILASLVLLGLGLSYSFVSFFFVSAADTLRGLPYLEGPLFQLGLFCFLVLAPLVFFLGQTVPLLLHTADKRKTKSEAAGNATAVSTIGNVIGCLATSLVLMYYLGVGYAIVVNCLILVVCLALLSEWKRTREKLIFGVAISLFAIAFTTNIRVADQLFVATTAYSNFHVAEHDSGTRLIINRSNASFIDGQARTGWPYIETIKKGLFSENISGKDVLVLGAGGFTLSAAGDHGARFTYLDIDPEIKNIAEQYFLQEPIKGQFIAQDARAYLLAEDRQWDFIIVDLYTNAATIPMHTATHEFFSLVSTRLAPSGKTILNVAANPTLKDPYSFNLDATIRQAFSGCITDITDYGDRLENIVYFCSKRNVGQPRTAQIYTDDSTRVAADGYVTALQLKQWIDAKE